MIGMKTVFFAGLVWALAALVPPMVSAQATEESDCGRIVEAMRADHAKLSTDLRRIQRDVAALRADIDGPTAQDVFAGVGYIFGLFGVAAYMSSRKRKG